MEKRRCEKCGANLTKEDVMKLVLEDGTCEILPFTACPECFTKQMAEKRFNSGD